MLQILAKSRGAESDCGDRYPSRQTLALRVLSDSKALRPRGSYVAEKSVYCIAVASYALRNKCCNLDTMLGGVGSAKHLEVHRCPDRNNSGLVSVSSVLLSAAAISIADKRRVVVICCGCDLTYCFATPQGPNLPTACPLHSTRSVPLIAGLDDIHHLRMLV